MYMMHNSLIILYKLLTVLQWPQWTCIKCGTQSSHGCQGRCWPWKVTSISKMVSNGVLSSNLFHYHQSSWHASQPADWLTFLPFSRIALQQSSLSGRLVLYHFVGSSSASSANPLLMLRRFTIQVITSCGLYLYLQYSISKYASTVYNIIKFRLCFLVIGWFTTYKCLQQQLKGSGQERPLDFLAIFESAQK